MLRKIKKMTIDRLLKPKLEDRNIYLSPVIRSGYGEETFWVWFERKFKNSSYDLPKKFKKNDIILRYSTKGVLKSKNAKVIALCWELLPEMKKVLKSNEWDKTIESTFETAKHSDKITVASRFSIPYYEKFGKVDLLPIGVDTDLFREFSKEEKKKMKEKYDVPNDVEVGFWCGTIHEMKGFQNVKKYANENKKIYWIIVWYGERGNFVGNGQEHYLVNQKTMAELMNCANFQLSASILKPFYIIEYEGMACNLPQRKIVDIEKDFEPGDNPRNAIFEHGWDRHSAKKAWHKYLSDL